jgi:hypothetical protein
MQMFGAIFFDKGSYRNNSTDIFNIAGALYAATLFLGFQNSSTVQPVIDTERSVRLCACRAAL